MCHKVKTHAGYKRLAAQIVVKSANEKMFVGAFVEKRIVNETRDILDQLFLIARDNPKKSFQEVLQQLSCEYHVKIEVEDEHEQEHGQVKMFGVSIKNTPHVSLLITAA